MDTILNFINNNKSVTFIGMPGTGKTYTTDYISNKYNIPKIELDENIEKKYNNTLPKIINKYGEKEFKNIECNAILDIDFDKPKLISTGGSVIYCEKGMKYLMDQKPELKYQDVHYVWATKHEQLITRLWSLLLLETFQIEWAMGATSI